MTLDKQLFKTYDIRGQDITHDQAYLIGRACGSYLQATYKVYHVVVGHDLRLNSAELREGLIIGLIKSGCAVIDIGPVATPVLYLNAYRKGCAGIMITASHLGREFNGFKFVVGRKIIFDQELQAIYTLAKTENFYEGAGTRHSFKGTNEHYTQTLTTAYRPGRLLTVAVDAGNGMAGLYIVDMLRQLGHSVIPLYTDPDFTFPHHAANPAAHNTLKELIATVKTHRADLGLAFDGDADRVGVVDNTGASVSIDRVVAWLVTDILKRHPEAGIVADVMTSQFVFDTVEQLGGQAHMCRTGHAYARSKLQQVGAMLGSEVSGHMFFADRYYGFDDGLYAAGRIVEAVAASPRSLSESLATLPQVFTTPVYRPACPPEIKSQVIPAVKTKLDQFPIVELDGLRITFPHGWGILRLSNTEPKLSLRFEADTEAEVLSYQSYLQDILTTIHPAFENFNSAV